MSEEPTKEMIAFMELKSQIVKLMHAFTEKYCGENNPDSLYPKTPYIIVDVLTRCLSEAQYQVADYQPFTCKQVDFICYQIGDWYLMWRDGISEDRNHKLGYAKEKLKEMICPERGD